MDDKSVLIVELKKEHSHIYSVSDSNGTEYLFRALTLSEVGSVEEFIQKRLKSSIEIEDYCLNKCLLSPEDIDLDDISPGAAKQIAEEILTVSGITDAEFILEAMHFTRGNLSGDIVLSIKAYIISAIPAYTDSDLDKYTLLELIEKLILAETILTLQAQMAGMDSNIQLNFEQADEEGEAQPAAPQEKKKQPAHVPTKEELIGRINSKTTDNRSTRPQASEFDDFDPSTLERMAGVASEDDPLARKLHGLG